MKKLHTDAELVAKARVPTEGLMRHKQDSKPRKIPRKKRVFIPTNNAPSCHSCHSDNMKLMGRVGREECFLCKNCGHVTKKRIW